MANLEELLKSSLTPEDSGDTRGQECCPECNTTNIELVCRNCQEPFCRPCYDTIHRTGNRKLHETSPLSDNPLNNGASVSAECPLNGQTGEVDMGMDMENSESLALEGLEDNLQEDSYAGSIVGPFILQEAKYIPMRLTLEERRLLHLLEAALSVSEYTDKVDILLSSSRHRRVVTQIKEMCSVLAGLVVASDMNKGQELLADKDFAANAAWYQQVFEVGRRYKIMNPEKMRDSFGKLVYMVMDSRTSDVRSALDFDLYQPIKTVYSVLKDHSALQLLEEPLLAQATKEIISSPEKSRSVIQSEIQAKQKAIEVLASKYRRQFQDKEHVRQVLYSIGDFHAYLRANRRPVELILSQMEENFDPETPRSSETSLDIRAGKSGARLSHSHSKQHTYVRQSLSLWSQILRHMFMLWYLADEDLLSCDVNYRLADTGQGLNRIKPCPQVGKAMYSIIRKSQTRLGSWVGSSVVHLGDSTVPNALFFLDKYLQVPRILTPIYLCLDQLDSISRDPYIAGWIESQFSSVSQLKLHILADFFKHAFDGSGADNFYDAGSCIDGRLTSAWNWANSIAKKPYYRVLLVAGFTGFNGSDGF